MVINKVVYDVFNSVINYAYIGKKYKSDWNDKLEKNNIKTIFNYDIKHNNHCWNDRFQHDKQLIQFRENLKSRIPNNSNLYYLYKCTQIPIKHECSILAIIQIAFNIGLIKANEQFIDDFYLEQFYNLKLSNIETYILPHSD